MSWNPDEFADYREYGSMGNTSDYSDPTYYKQEESKTPRSAQPVQSLESPPTYPAYTPPASPDMYAYDPAQMSAYRGPSSLEGYTVDAGAEQRKTAEEGKKRKGLAGLGGLGATIVALLVKFNTLLLLFAKVGFAGITALISIGVYALIFGWQFAVGLVALLFIHEMIFIPLLGAAVLMRRMPKNARDEAEVGIAGPIAGALAASVCFLLAQSNPGSIWAPLAYFGFFINLFNLIPIIPFDGGRILAAIDRRMWIIGFLGLVAFQVWSFIRYGSISIWLLFFILMAGTQLWSRRSVANTPEAQAYYKVSISERIVLTLAYFGLAAVLVLGMTISHGLIQAVP